MDEIVLTVDLSQPQANDLVGRLRNWKFESALQYLEGQPLDVKELVQTLARLFSNSGWFDGDMASLVTVAVGQLLESCEK